MAKDPYRYFRIEARELVDGLTRGVLELQRGPVTREAVARLLRLAHTLKGAARVVKQPAIAELAHAAEEAMARHREGGAPLPAAEGSALLELFDDVARKVDALDGAPAAPAAPAPRPGGDERVDTLRVELEELDAVQRGVADASVQLGAARKATGRLHRLDERLLALKAWGAGARGEPVAALAEELRGELKAAREAIDADLERAERRVEELGDSTLRLRLVPAHSIFPSLERSVREAAQALGVSATLSAEGGEVRLDANVLAALKDALMHVVRNAVVHGVEPQAERVKANKPPVAAVRLSFERRGNRVVITCADDGRGIDLQAVRRAATERGLLPATEAAKLSPQTLVKLLSRGGLSTSPQVTELAGRGIGLDVARATAARLKGRLELSSQPGQGTTVELDVPVSLASLQALFVEASGRAAAIPLEQVREALRVRAQDVAQGGAHASVMASGGPVRFMPLERVLPRAAKARPKAAFTAVVVEGRAGRLAVGVDRLLGTSSLTMRELPAVMQAHPAVAGASLDGEGNPQLVLDADGLFAFGDGQPPDVSPAARARPPPVLVVDDSLTTRMLEQSILESAGYDVELAVSAEEALEKARQHRYSLFVVDVEMPGMDGFDFVAQTRRDAQLREIPAILVTSRGAPEDKRRGEQAGARAYIVKSEFDQGRLLDTIRGLIGTP